MVQDFSTSSITLNASRGILDKNSQTQTWGEDVTLSAIGANGSSPMAIAYGKGGFAVDAGRYDYQIDFDAVLNQSEQFIIDFNSSVDSAEVELGLLSVDEWKGLNETGRWTTYDGFGNQVGQGILDPKSGESTGGGAFKFTIDDVEDYSQIVIEATAYGNGADADRTKNNSDFNVRSLTYTPTNSPFPSETITPAPAPGFTPPSKPTKPVKPEKPVITPPVVVEPVTPVVVEPMTPVVVEPTVPVVSLVPTAPANAKLWSEIETQAGKPVVIAKGETVILDTDTANLAGVIVEGELLFSENYTDTNGNGSLDFTADWLLVRKGGYLEIGTEDDLYEADTTITLDGADQDVMGMGMGGRFIIATGAAADGTESRISMHGVDGEKTSWTQLSASVSAGNKVITLAEKVSWEAGDEIVVAPSGFDATEAERRTVVAVKGNKVTLDKALSYDHYGKVEMVDGKPLDMRAEVGLLSRNIDIQGAEDALKSEFGAHMMFMKGSSVQISGVEIQRGGQVGKQGRYPIHWHKGGNHQGDYLKDSSIYDSFQRGIVTHGVDNVEVDSNVVYNVFGHAYTFSEDGDEVGNTFTDNLSLLVKTRDRSDFAFPVSMHFKSGQAEHRASGFWGRNYYNPLIGNHSAGTVEGNGFFMDAALLSHSAKQGIIKSSQKNVFKDNLSHSNMMTESATNPHYGPLTRGHGLLINSYDKKSGSDIVFEDFTTYKNNVSGVWIEDDRHVLRNAVIADSASGIVTMRSSIEDVVMTRNSANKIGGVLGQDRQILSGGGAIPAGIHVKRSQYGVNPNIKNVTFMNFDNAIAVHKQTTFGKDSTIRGSKLINTDDAIYWDVDGRKPISNPGVLVDLDGTLTGRGRRTNVTVKFSSK